MGFSIRPAGASVGRPSASAPTPHTKRDWPLAAAVAVVAVLALVISAPVACSLRMSGRHHAFVKDLAESLVYAREHGSLSATLDGAAIALSADDASRIFEQLADAGMGRPSSAAPSGGLRMEFGNGSSLELCRADLSGTEGLLVRYTGRDGATFSYDTDKLTLGNLVRRP